MSERLPVIGNIYNADWLAEHARECSTGLSDGRYVAARPIHHQHMFWFERLAVAWQVFRGKYDALEWTGQ